MTEEKPEYARLIYKERYRLKFILIMENHVLCLLEAGKIPLSKIMQGILQSFTQYYKNKQEKGIIQA